MTSLRAVCLATAACAGLLMLNGATCSPAPADPGPPLEHAYAGQLELLYTQDLPQISETVRMQVQVDRDGRMTIEPGVLSYDGEWSENDSRLRRSGTVNLAPTGAWFDDNGVDRLAVNENGSGTDRIQQWVFDGAVWRLILDQTTDIDWRGGLAFSLDDAVLTGSVVEVNAGTFRARWTLTLTPVLE